MPRAHRLPRLRAESHLRRRFLRARFRLCRWADTNNIIVLFPQTAATPLNPQGCWDWWGYTGSEYLTREAPQITAVYRMLERLTAPRSSS
ncbi:MAG: hypothetical protein WDN31_12225 [Hyphomicrobium sp.]